MTAPAALYACLCVREFPAQALLRLRPELRNQACVVMEGEDPSLFVCSLNAHARLLQMVHGMTRVEVDTFPTAVVLRRCSATEAATKALLLECAGACSPRMEERSEDTVYVCVLDIAGTHGLFGPPESLARNLLQRVRAQGIQACVTVSANFHTAVFLAMGLPAKIAIKVVPAGEEAAALASLPLAVLDLTEAQAKTFAGWGIHTLGMLAALPEKELIARMGQHGRRLRQAARGDLPHLFQPVAPALLLAERIELDTPIDLLESLLFVIHLLLEQLILLANTHLVALATVTITLTLEGADICVRTVRPALPTNDKALWLKLLQLELEAHPPQASILSVLLTAEPGSTSKVQLGIFAPQLPEPGRLDVTLARLRAVVGENNVGSAALQDTHAQENFRMERFHIPSGNSAIATLPSLYTSLRHIRPAEAASVRLENGRPRMFAIREQRYAVQHAYGPWRKSGAWWNTATWGMELWDLVSRGEDGSLLCCCMMHDLMRNQWQMTALYD
jgi:protein ImuB